MTVRPPYQHVHKILVVSPTWLGDTVISLPTLYGIRSLFPDARIAILARDAIADIFEAVPVVDEVIPFTKSRGVSRLYPLLRTAGVLRKTGFDLAILLTRSIETALLCAAARIPARIGFTSALRTMLLTEKLDRTAAVRAGHQVHYYKKLLEPLGAAHCPGTPHLIVPEAARAWADRFLQDHGVSPSACLIGFNPGSTYGKAKQWLPEKFRDLARRLMAAYTCHLVVCGDPATGELARTIGRGLTPGLIDATGRTSALQLAAVLERCAVLVTNDTGPMHVAGAVGTPVAAIFGSTNPLTTGPLASSAETLQAAMPCSPCLKRTCPEGHYRCMHAVGVDDVEAAAVKLLGLHGWIPAGRP